MRLNTNLCFSVFWWICHTWVVIRDFSDPVPVLREVFPNLKILSNVDDFKDLEDLKRGSFYKHLDLV